MSDITTIRQAVNSLNLVIRIREHYDSLGRNYSVQVADRKKRLLEGGHYKTVWSGKDICQAADLMDSYL